MVTEADLELGDGRTLHYYDTREDGSDARAGGAQAWGLEPAAIAVPVLILHGAMDRMVPCAHGEWLAAHCPTAGFRLVSEAGHITVLDSAPKALEWLRDRVADDLNGRPPAL
jgi:pimeloyl-ACP methyl ester carboxylesterase